MALLQQRQRRCLMQEAGVGRARFCPDMCADICAGMHAGMCIDMCKGVRVVMCQGTVGNAPRRGGHYEYWHERLG